MEISDYTTVLGPENALANGQGRAWNKFAAGLRDPLARLLAALWYRLAREKGALAREDFSFEMLAPFAQNLIIAKAEPKDWKLTYCGPAVAEFLEFDPSGQYLSDFGDTATVRWWRDNFSHLRTYRSYIEYSRLGFADKHYLRVETLNLPIASDRSQPPDMDLAYMTCLPVEPDDQIRRPAES